MKTCTKCKCKKSLDEFSNDKSKDDGKRPSCKACKKQSDSIYRQQHKSQKAKKDHEYYSKHINKIKDYSKQWSVINKEHIKKVKREYFVKNYKHIKDKQKEWNEQNISKMRKYMNEYIKDKYANDLNYRIRSRLRSRLRQSITNKTCSCLEYIGCTLDFLKEWFEFHFTSTLNWENIDTWHIDHVIPCDSFDLTNERMIYECFNWKNLRPLNGIENIKKHNNLSLKILTNHYDKIFQFLLKKHITDVPSI